MTILRTSHPFLRRFVTFADNFAPDQTAELHASEPALHVFKCADTIELMRALVNR